MDAFYSKYKKLLSDFRRELHAIPEIGYKEFKTKEYIMNALSKLSAFKIYECTPTGIKAVCIIDPKLKTLGFRADMDALEITEQTNAEYCSKHEGFMHACGHDGHMAMILALANYINYNLESIKYNVVLIFQPAEESYGGAKSMIDNEALNNPDIDVLFGFHLMPSLAIGKIGYRCGALMAQASEFDVEFIGKAAHGAMPEKGCDALAAACQFVTSSQGIVSRCVDPYQQCVLTYGAINGGTLRNIVCDKCIIKGTMRSFSDDVYQSVKNKIISAASGAANMYGCSARYTERVVYPFVNNPEKETIRAVELINDTDLETVAVDPMMIAEDFSFYQRKIPAVFLFLGCLDEKNPRKLHSEYFDFDEDVLVHGLNVYITLLKFF